jgi:hypothetical protein
LNSAWSRAYKIECKYISTCIYVYTHILYINYYLSFHFWQKLLPKFCLLLVLNGGWVYSRNSRKFKMYEVIQTKNWLTFLLSRDKS